MDKGFPRQGVENYFHIETKGNEFELIKQLEQEVKAKNKPSPATNSAFHEILEHEGKIQDGLGGGKPNDFSLQKKEKADEE